MARTEGYRKWTAAEIAYLHETYDKDSADGIAEALDRSLDSVWAKAEQEGLRKHRKRHKRDKDGPWYCPECGDTKPKEEFSVDKNGRGSGYCKACLTQKQTEYRKTKQKKEQKNALQ